MKSEKSLLYGIVVAAGLSLVSVLLGTVLAFLLFGSLALNLLIGSLALLYVFAIFRGSKSKSGHTVSAVLGILVLPFGAVILPTNLYFLMAVALVWMLRSLHSYRSIVASLIDLSLCVLSIGAGLLGYVMSGSIVAAVWCFFLTQSLYVFIPKDGFSLSAGEETAGESPPQTFERFLRAHQAAESALRQMM